MKLIKSPLSRGLILIILELTLIRFFVEFGCLDGV